MAINIEGEMVEVIDAHTHMNNRPLRFDSRGDTHSTQEFVSARDFTADMMIRDMDEVGIDRAITFPAAQPATDYSVGNAGVAEAMQKYPHRLIGFCRLNPRFGPEATAKMIDHCIKDLGLRGIKLEPEIEWFPTISETLMFPIMDKAREYRIPVLIHCGGPHSTPAMLGYLADLYPDVIIIMGHMGLDEGVDDAVIVAKKAENLVLETSVCSWLEHHLGPAIRAIGPTRLVFGSDHPHSPFGLELDKLVKYAPRYTGLKKEDLKMILNGNIRKILGLR